MLNPGGFLSYSHFDDNHDDGLVSQLAIRIASEVQAQLGYEFHLFIDRKDIKWGQAWKIRLGSGLATSTFFMPVLTPSYFRSEYCVAEAVEFLGSERQLMRSDLVLPIYYIDVDDSLLDSSDLRKQLTEHQFLDWRDLRFEPLTAPEIRKRIASAAADICKAIKVSSEDSSLPDTSKQVTDDAVDSTESCSTSVLSAISGQRIEPTLIIVDPHDCDAYCSISDAIEHAGAGARILIRPGVYYEIITIEKPIELIGAGASPNSVKVHGGGGPTITVNTSFSRISNISFFQDGQGENDNEPAALVTQGRPDIDNCEFVSSNGIGLRVSNSDPVIRNCSIHNCASFGVVFESQSRGSLEDCDIYENRLSNVLVCDKSNPSIRRCTIHHGHQSGIYINDFGYGMIENNDVFDNSHAGLATSHDGSPIVRGNRITRSKHYGGIYVFKKGAGIFERNDLRGNPHGAFQVTEKCKPYIQRVDNRER